MMSGKKYIVGWNVHKKWQGSQVWRHGPVIPEQGKVKEKKSPLEARLSYRVSFSYPGLCNKTLLQKEDMTRTSNKDEGLNKYRDT